MAALALAACIGTTQAAFVVCITPAVLSPEEVRPLVMSGLETLSDGRVVSRVRFETWPILAGLLATAGAGAIWASILRHWRLEGWLEELDGEVPQGWWMLNLGAFAASAGLIHHLVERALEIELALVPLMGGLLEVGCLWMFCSGLLEMARTGRRLMAQPRLLAGMTLALLPPIVELIRYLLTWTP